MQFGSDERRADNGSTAGPELDTWNAAERLVVDRTEEEVCDLAVMRMDERELGAVEPMVISALCVAAMCARANTRHDRE